MGLKLVEHSAIDVFGIDPSLLKKLAIKERGQNQLEFAVTAKVPSELMGSGLGSDSPFRGDYDIQTSDSKTLERHGLQNLKFGDLVAIMDHQCHYGYCYKKGAITIGVIIHGDSFLAGHGPGVQVIMTSQKKGDITPRIDDKANIGRYLSLGRFRRAKKK
jgi:hypothetical protein